MRNSACRDVDLQPLPGRLVLIWLGFVPLICFAFVSKNMITSVIEPIFRYANLQSLQTRIVHDRHRSVLFTAAGPVEANQEYTLF